MTTKLYKVYYDNGTTMNMFAANQKGIDSLAQKYQDLLNDFEEDPITSFTTELVQPIQYLTVETIR